MLSSLIGCQTAPPPAASVPDVVRVPPAGSATAAPENILQAGDSGYLTRDHGCALMAESAAEDLLRRANAAITRAGEHPTQADPDEILPLLHRAAGVEEAVQWRQCVADR